MARLTRAVRLARGRRHVGVAGYRAGASRRRDFCRNLWESGWYIGVQDETEDENPIRPRRPARQVWVAGVAQDGTFADAFTVRYLDDLSGSVSGVWTEGFGVSTAQEGGIAMTVFEDEPYITGAQGTSISERMLALAYYQDTPYTHSWNRTFTGPYLGLFSNEGRGVVVAVVQNSDNGRSVYVVGVSTESGEGRQFTLLRYKE